MARDIFEKDKLTVVALLQKGKPAEAAVEFIFKMDGAEVPEGKGKIKGDISADPAARTGKAATCKFDPPEVPPDKPNYLLEYIIKVDSEEISDRTQFTVWPKKGKLTVVHDEDDKVFPDFKFTVVQNETAPKNPYISAGDPAVAEFKLEKGFPFTVENADPFEIKTMSKNGTALRDLKAKGVLNFTAEFVKPTIPADKKLKQWVNLEATAKKGQDGLGSKVLFQVGVKGDREDNGTTKAKILGKAGVPVFVKVKFGPDPGKSKRTTPKTELVAGGNASDIAAVTDGVEYTARVDLGAAGGVGEFEVELGYAGGDTCEVSIGSTKACADAKVEITNWRKFWYEVNSPDFMELEERDLPDGSKAWDLVAAARQNMKDSGDATFVEYEWYKAQKFTEAEAEAKFPYSVLDRRFWLRAPDAAKVFVLNDFTVKQYVKNFDKGKAPRCLFLKACDELVSRKGEPRDLSIRAGSAQADVAVPDGIWTPTSAKDGTDAITDIVWQAAVVAASYHGAADVEFDADADTGDATDNDQRTISIAEIHQNPAVCGVLYSKSFFGLIGNIGTDVDDTAKAAIDAWLAGLWSDANVRPHGFKLKFRLTGALGNERRVERFATLRKYLTDKVASSAPKLYKHLGLEPDGSLRNGSLDWATVVNMDRSTIRKIAIDLPAADPGDPGSLVGASSATTCPIDLWVTVEPQSTFNGLAGHAPQEIAVKWGEPGAPLCISDTFLHEAGHKFNMAVVANGDDQSLHQHPNAAAEHAPGLPIPKNITQDETNNDYKHNGDKGHMYVAMGHTGRHCCYGLSDAQKAAPANTSGACTMYGSGGRNDATRTRLSFCVQCRDYLRARHLSGIT